MEKDLEKAFFGIRKCNLNTNEFDCENLFGSVRVLRSIALLRTDKYLSERYTDIDSVIGFCFGDTMHRVEWEMGIQPVFHDDRVEKVDVFYMYVEPNKQLLYDMVMNFSIASCERVLEKYK